MTDASTRGEPASELDVERDLAVWMFEVMVLTPAVEDRMVAMYRGGDQVALRFCGDGSTSRADLHGSPTIASARHKALADPMPDPSDIEEGVHAD